MELLVLAVLTLKIGKLMEEQVCLWDSAMAVTIWRTQMEWCVNSCGIIAPMTQSLASMSGLVRLTQLFLVLRLQMCAPWGLCNQTFHQVVLLCNSNGHSLVVMLPVIPTWPYPPLHGSSGVILPSSMASPLSMIFQTGTISNWILRQERYLV